MGEKASPVYRHRRGTWLVHQALRFIRRKARGDDLYEGIDLRMDILQDAFFDLCDDNGLEATIMVREKNGTRRSASIRFKDSDWEVM